MKNLKLAKAIISIINVLLINPITLMLLLYLFNNPIGYLKALAITIIFNIINGDYRKKI